VVVGKALMFMQWHTSFHDTPSIVFKRDKIDGVYTKSTAYFAEDFEVVFPP
jgi:hypothetical protein